MIKTTKRIARTLTTVPKGLRAKDVLKNAAIFGGVGILSALLSSDKDKRWGNALLWGALGSAAGGYGTMVARNLRREMGGHYKYNPHYYNTSNLVEAAKRSGKDTAVLYVPGVSDADGGVDKSLAEQRVADGVFTYRWGDGEKLAEAIRALKAAGIKAKVVSHSAGATAVMDAKQALNSADSVDLLDPVDINMRSIYSKFNSRHYGEELEPVAGKVKLHLATRPYRESHPSSRWNNLLSINPLAVREIDGARTIYHADDHAMNRSGLRLPRELENYRDWADSIRSRLART